MNRVVIYLAAVALCLGGCSGKSKESAAGAKVVKDSKGKVVPAPPNPWNSNSATDVAPPDPAKEKKAKQKAAAKANAKKVASPWAKDPPADPAAQDQAKT